MRDKKKICIEELKANVDNNYRKHTKAFWKFVNGSIKSSTKNKIETLTDHDGKSLYSHTVKIKILE